MSESELKGAEARVRELERELAELKQRAGELNRYGGDPRLNRLLGDPLVLANFPHVICVIDRDLRILYLNRAVPGRSPQEYVGTDSLDVMSPENREPYREAFLRAWSSGEPTSLEVHSATARWWESRFVPVHDGSEVVCMLVTSTDITQRKLQEQALRESESRARLSLLASGVGTWTWSTRTDELIWDDALCAIFGVDPSRRPRGRDEYLAMIHPEDRAEAAAVIASYVERGTYEGMAYRIVRPDGAIRHVIARGMAVFDDKGQLEFLRGGVLDVTERKELEASLEHAQRMQAVGQLTAGIAHNLNNALSVILPNLAECREFARGVVASRLEEVEHAFGRAAEMVRQLMLFARPQDNAERHPFDLAASARRVVEMCRSTFDRRIQLELSAAERTPAVIGNPGQIEQVLLNICLNARDAVLESARPDPKIQLRIEPLNAQRVLLRVADNGTGMTEAVRARVFEPFFTTKDVGRGTGLGLASAYAIITDHGGSIRVSSRLGEGTQLELELRASSEPLAARSVPAGAPVPAGCETILLVDDEDAVRRVFRRMLERSGFQVVECENGAEAIAMLQSDASSINALLIDRSMPGLSGEQVIARLGELGIHLPILLLSGHPNIELANPDVLAVLSKPITRQALLNAVRGALDEWGLRRLS